MATKSERAIATARSYVHADVLAANVELPHGFKPKVKWTPFAAGIDHRLTHLLNDFCDHFNTAGCRELDIYQFGVFTGTGWHKIGASIKRFGHLWGFDSFKGIPAEADQLEQMAWRGARNFTNKFRQGQYSAADAMGVYNQSELIGYVAQRVNRPNTTFVPGYFSDSLTDALLRGHTFQPALLVDLDVDIHSSTVQAMDWMFANKLIVPSTFVRYDDWPFAIADSGAASGTTFYGQARAHYEMTRKWRVRWRHVAKNALVVLSIGDWHCAPQTCNRAPPLNGDNVSASNLIVTPPLSTGLPRLPPDE